MLIFCKKPLPLLHAPKQCPQPAVTGQKMAAEIIRRRGNGRAMRRSRRDSLTGAGAGNGKNGAPRIPIIPHGRTDCMSAETRQLHPVGRRDMQGDTLCVRNPRKGTGRVSVGMCWVQDMRGTGGRTESSRPRYQPVHPRTAKGRGKTRIRNKTKCAPVPKQVRNKTATLTKRKRSTSLWQKQAPAKRPPSHLTHKKITQDGKSF